jgi:hypothetical protein
VGKQSATIETRISVEFGPEHGTGRFIMRTETRVKMLHFRNLETVPERRLSRRNAKLQGHDKEQLQVHCCAQFS